jgi:hypothetical protein
MTSFLKSCALATLFSLALATTAKAAQQPTFSTPQVQSQGILIADDNGPIDEQAFKQARMIHEMMGHYMKVSETAMELMQSTNPEVNKMAQEMFMESNNRFDRLMLIRQMMLNRSRGR